MRAAGVFLTGLVVQSVPHPAARRYADALAAALLSASALAPAFLEGVRIRQTVVPTVSKDVHADGQKGSSKRH